MQKMQQDVARPSRAEFLGIVCMLCLFCIEIHLLFSIDELTSNGPFAVDREFTHMKIGSQACNSGSRHHLPIRIVQWGGSPQIVQFLCAIRGGSIDHPCAIKKGVH